MDRLHEELKEPVCPENNNDENENNTRALPISDGPEKRRTRAGSPSLDGVHHRTRSNESLTLSEETEMTYVPDNDAMQAQCSEDYDERVGAGEDGTRGQGVNKNHPHRRRAGDSVSETEPLHPNPTPSRGKTGADPGFSFFWGGGGGGRNFV